MSRPRAWCSAVVCWLALVSSPQAWGQLEIRLETLPPDCQILWSSPTGPRLMPARGGMVDLPEVDPRKVDKVDFVLLKPGYRDRPVSVPTRGLAPGARQRWPSEPGAFIRLEPILVSLTIHSIPPGADVYLQEFPGSVQYLGRTEEELHFNLARVGGLAARGQVELILKHTGYNDTTVSLPATFLQPGQDNIWPHQGGVALSPRWWFFSPLLDFLLHHPLAGAFLATMIGFLLVRLGQLGLATWRRVRSLEGKVAQAGFSAGRLAGCRLDAYRLLRLLGKGGMATVYLAIPDHSLQESDSVAVKVLNEPVSPGKTRDPQFLSEVQSLLKLRHPNLVRLEDWGEFQGLLYLVLEYVAGPTLRQFQGAPLSEVAPLLADVFAAVHYAHSHGIVHADLKPENILVTPQGRAKVTDFGLAVAVGQTDVEGGGTLAYLAPERFRGSPPTPASDQFALGRLVAELLPHHAGVAVVCGRMLRDAPEERYPSVQESWEALAAALAVSPQGGRA